MSKFEDKKPSDVLADFKKATHALLDALELGFFKRVEVDAGGKIVDSGQPIKSVARLEIRPIEGEEKIHVNVVYISKKDSYPAECLLEELTGSSHTRQGLFLDPQDAQISMMERAIRLLEKDRSRAEQIAAEKAKEIDMMATQIAKLKKSC